MKKTNRSGTTRTEEQLAAAGWAPQIQVRVKAKLGDALDKMAQPGETRAGVLKRLATEKAIKLGILKKDWADPK